ncbi:hypothetical protein X727_27620 [Mesorhizobium sp. L103C119B0]|nr:hypothetical protein X727_27620 [Mesorhizobium sp. L103C119B0]
MTGFLVKLLRCEPGKRKAEEVGQGRCSGGAAPAIAMAFRFQLSDRNGKKLKQGLRRTMITSLAVANAVMMSICSSLGQNISRVVRGHASLATRSA